jgi:hypothetical protein
MNEHRRLANLALHLIEGAQRDDEQADALLAEAFESHAVAAVAHAYLTGFVVQVLAGERREPVEATIARVRLLLNS